MCNLPSKSQTLALQAAELRAKLLAKNKEQAKAQLLSISLILARRPNEPARPFS